MPRGAPHMFRGLWYNGPVSVARKHMSEGKGAGNTHGGGNQPPKKFHFKIENDPYTWDEQFITGEQVRSVGPGIPATMDLYLKRKGAPGELVTNDQKVDLA